MTPLKVTKAERRRMRMRTKTTKSLRPTLTTRGSHLLEARKRLLRANFRRTKIAKRKAPGRRQRRLIVHGTY